MKKFLLSSMLLACISAFAQTSGECGVSATWNYNSTTKELKFEGTYGTGDYKYDQSNGSDAPWAKYRNAVTTITFGEGMTYAGKYCFRNFTALTKVNFPSTMLGIDNSAFSGCSSLESIDLPGAISDVRTNTFADCTKLKNVIIGEGIESFFDWAFNGCTSLKTLTLPSTMTKLDHGSLDDCPLTSLVSKAETAPTIYNDVFSVSELTVYIPVGSLASYQEKWGSLYPNFTFIEKDVTSTAVIKTEIEKSALEKNLKTIENGKVVIIRNGVKYDLNGTKF